MLCEFCNTETVNKKEETLDKSGSSIIIYECNCGRTIEEKPNIDSDGYVYMED